MATGGVLDGRKSIELASETAIHENVIPYGRCSRHPIGLLIEWYCKDHASAFCLLCKKKEHSECNDVKFIPEFAKGIRDNLKFRNLNAELESVQSDVDEMLAYMKTIKPGIDDGCTSIIEELRMQREQINKSFDIFEKRIIDDVKKFQAKDSSKLNNDMKEFCEFKDVFHNFETKFSNPDLVANESQTFINMIECQNLIETCNTQMRSISATALPVGYHLNICKTYAELLETLKNLNTFKLEKTFSRNSEKRMIPIPVTTQNKLHYGRIDRTRSITIKQDRYICNLYDLCKLPNGKILLTNKNNKTVIRLNRSLKVKDKCKLKQSPSSIACINEEEAVIAASGNTIVFVDTQKQLSVTNTLPMTHKCSGIAYRRGMLYVSDDCSTINVYSKGSGNILSSIVADHIGLQMFSEIRHMAISPDGTRIYVADSKKGLVILDSNGQYITTVQGRLLDGAFGVCVGDSGNVYVSGLMSMNVVQIEPNNLKVTEVARMKEGEYPQSICIDETKKLLLVTLYSSNSFKAFDLGY